MKKVTEHADEDAVEKLIEAAEAHGDDVGSDYQIGDLEEVCRLLWRVLTPEQRAAAWQDDAVQTLLVNLPGGS